MLGLATAGLICNIVWAWPQVVALMRAKRVGAVSPTTWALIAVTTAPLVSPREMWDLWVVVIINASLFLASVLVLVIGTRLGWSRNWLLAAAVGSALAVFGPTYLLVNVWVDCVVLVPQLARLARTRTAESVSLTAWLLYLGQFIFWALPHATRGPAWIRTGLLDVSVLLHVAVGVAMVVLLVLVRRRSSSATSGVTILEHRRGRPGGCSRSASWPSRCHWTSSLRRRFRGPGRWWKAAGFTFILAGGSAQLVFFAQISTSSFWWAGWAAVLGGQFLMMIGIGIDARSRRR